MFLFFLLHHCGLGLFSIDIMTYRSRSTNHHFWPDFIMCIVSDLNDLTFIYTNIELFNYTVTINAYLGNIYNEIFKYDNTEHFSIIVFLFVMCTILLLYTPLLLLLVLLALFLLVLLLSMINTCKSQFTKSEMLV